MGIFVTKIGIDLGTANTLVYIPGKGIVLNEPSVVAVDQQTNRIMAVGLEAKQMIGRTPDNIVAYRPMKDGVIADYRVTEAMIRYYMSKALGKWNILKPEVMVSVPAGVSSTERRAVIEATIKAGAKNVYVVKEPILAAIGAGIPIYEARGHMVVDIGGGTTDVAVISLGGIVASTSVKCAGNKIDHAIADYIKKTFNLAIGDRTAEEIKVRIGSAVSMDDELLLTIKGRDYVTGLPRTAQVTTNEIVKAIDRELREIVRAIKDMTGGSSQLRNLPELVVRRTGVKAVLAEDALYCVVKGTGIALEHLDTYKKSILAKK